jgi:hypothetical protein
MSETDPNQPSHETEHLSTADRIRALADTVAAESTARQKHNQRVTNGHKLKLARFVLAGGFKQNVELPRSQDDRRLSFSAAALRQVVHVLPDTSADGPIVIAPDDGSSLSVEEQEGTVRLVIAGLTEQPQLYTIGRNGPILENPPAQPGDLNPEPTINTVGFRQALEHFSSPQLTNTPNQEPV